MISLPRTVLPRQAPKPEGAPHPTAGKHEGQGAEESSHGRSLHPVHAVDYPVHTVDRAVHVVDRTPVHAVDPKESLWNESSEGVQTFAAEGQRVCAVSLAEQYAEYGTSPPTISRIRDSALPIHHKMVLIALTSRARIIDGEGWQAWPSLPTLANDCSMSRAKVAECIADLRRVGALEGSVTDERDSTTYRLDFKKLQSITPRGKKQKTMRFK